MQRRDEAVPQRRRILVKMSRRRVSVFVRVRPARMRSASARFGSSVASSSRERSIALVASSRLPAARSAVASTARVRADSPSSSHVRFA